MLLTPTHLAIVMEYASGGELFERICTAGRFSEHEVPTSLFLYFVHNFCFCMVDCLTFALVMYLCVNMCSITLFVCELNNLIYICSLFSFL